MLWCRWEFLIVLPDGEKNIKKASIRNPFRGKESIGVSIKNKHSNSWSSINRLHEMLVRPTAYTWNPQWLRFDVWCSGLYYRLQGKNAQGLIVLIVRPLRSKQKPAVCPTQPELKTLGHYFNPPPPPCPPPPPPPPPGDIWRPNWLKTL